MIFPVGQIARCLAGLVFLIGLLGSCATQSEASITIPLQELRESQTISLDGKLIHYYDWGPQDAPTVLACVHGWAGGGIDFYALSQSFASSNQRVRIIAVDLPGAGFSQRPTESLGMDGTTHFLALWLEYVRTKLISNPQTQLFPLAHSMGGHILLRTLWRYRFGEIPGSELSVEDQRLRVLISSFDKIVLMAPDGLRGEEGLVIAFRNRSIIRKFGPLLSADLLRMNTSSVYFDPKKCPPIVDQLTFEAFQYQNGFQALADITMDTLADQPLDGQLGVFNLPVLLFWGKQDKVLRFRHSKVFATELPNVQFHPLDKCGHALQTDQADYVAQVIGDFVSLP